MEEVTFPPAPLGGFLAKFTFPSSIKAIFGTNCVLSLPVATPSRTVDMKEWKCFYSDFFFFFTPAAQKNTLFTILLFTIKVSRPPRTINHLPVRSHQHRYGDPTVRFWLKVRLFFICVLHLLPRPLFDGSNGKPKLNLGRDQIQISLMKTRGLDRLSHI